MYEAYFVNVNTGKLYRSGSPKDNKCSVYFPAFNVEGWSRINEATYNTMKKVFHSGFVAGATDKEINE